MRSRAVWQLSLCKMREFVREPEAVFWVFIFPILLTLALGVAFRSKGPDPILVGVQEGEGASQALAALQAVPGLEVEPVAPEAARQKLREGKLTLVVIPGDPLVFWFDPTRPESRAARLEVNGALQRAAGREDPLSVEIREIHERGSRYIDFLLPGLLGMNLMGTGMWGIGFSIVNARMRNLLKRLVATPMRKRDYLAGQLAGRAVFLFLEVGVLVGFAALVFGVPLRGSLLTLALVSAVGAMTFAGLGLLVASRARTIEGVSGLMNAVMLPMWILSGTFFSTARFPDAMQPLVQALPLTALNDALRGVMIDGASLAVVAPEVGIAAAWGGAAFAGALYLFRWR